MTYDYLKTNRNINWRKIVDKVLGYVLNSITAGALSIMATIGSISAWFGGDTTLAAIGYIGLLLLGWKLGKESKEEESK